MRGTEASAFFPFLQFSYWPWNYAPDTAKAVLGLARVHKALEPYLAAEAAERRAPLLRPSEKHCVPHLLRYMVCRSQPRSERDGLTI